MNINDAMTFVNLHLATESLASSSSTFAETLQFLLLIDFFSLRALSRVITLSQLFFSLWRKFGIISSISFYLYIYSLSSPHDLKSKNLKSSFIDGIPC